MKVSPLPTLLGSAAVVLSAAGVEASAGHQKAHQLQHSAAHAHGHAQPPRAPARLHQRQARCAFPTDDANLVVITPDKANAGWAMSPDEPCEPGKYCPFACKTGMVMNQWDPKSNYTYPLSMHGGLYCNQDGIIEKPFPDEPNCVYGAGGVRVVNNCRVEMSWCQTVVPGNEAMIIPNRVIDELVLAVPGMTYWEHIAAHYYVNPPGTGTEGCVWGDEFQPIGNWSPYVAGANEDENGMKFVKIGWNPIWESSDLSKTLPSYGLTIECDEGDCTGLPCTIDPTKGRSNVESKHAATGAGGSPFCVVTGSGRSEVRIVVFDLSNPPAPDHSPDKQTPTPAVTSAATPATTPEVQTYPPEPPADETLSTSLPPTVEEEPPVYEPSTFDEGPPVYEPSTTTEEPSTPLPPTTTEEPSTSLPPTTVKEPSTSLPPTTSTPTPTPTPTFTTASTTSANSTLSTASKSSVLSTAAATVPSLVPSFQRNRTSASHTTLGKPSTTKSNWALPTVFSGQFHKNKTSVVRPTKTMAATLVDTAPTDQRTTGGATWAPDAQAEAGRQQGSAAMAGLVVAFIAAAALL